MITIRIPKNGKAPNFNQEISSANNIKNRIVRLSTLSGLNKMAQYI